MPRIPEQAVDRCWSACSCRTWELGPSGFSDKTEHCGVAQAPPGGDGHSSTRKSECRTASAWWPHVACWHGRPVLWACPVSYTHLRAHETRHDLVCRLLLEK